MEQPKKYKHADHGSQTGKSNGRVKNRIGRMKEQMRRTFGKKGI